MDTKELGLAIRRARRKAKLTQKEAAARAGVSQAIWHYIEKNKRTVTPEVYRIVGRAVGLEVEVRINFACSVKQLKEVPIPTKPTRKPRAVGNS